MAKADTPIIQLKNVSFAYDEIDVLSDINFTVNAGDFVAVIGPNGGGKTTMMKLMLGLLKPRCGTVRIMGRNPLAVRPKVGYVPQHAVVQPSFPISVLDAVLMGQRREGRRWPGLTATAKEKAMNVLEMVNMEAYAQRRFDALSGGQKQRVLVARALVSDPELLLFDEPTSNIDPQGKVCLFEVIARLNHDITVILVSHDLISASSEISSVAAVNRHLIQRRDKELTPDMLALIYGSHDATCPLDDYIRGVSGMFEQKGGLQ